MTMTIASFVNQESDWPVPAERSRVLASRAHEVMPGGVNGASRGMAPFPISMARADGAYIEDVDGNRYLDFHCGFGSVILGHNDVRLRETITETLSERGVFFATAHELELELAERLTRTIPGAEQVVFGCTGTEMTYHAVRLARVHTDRRLVVKFEGSYHGWHDYLYWSVRFDPSRSGPAHDPIPVAGSSGMSSQAKAETLMCEYNDTGHLEELFGQYPDGIAAVIVEPIYHNGGVIRPAPGFLEACRDLCTQHGAVLIFDEVITGFRQALGGAQSLLGVTPDVTTLGKAIANGFPIAVLAGRKDVMRDLAPVGGAYYSGTFNGHLLNVAVAKRCCEILEFDPPYETLAAVGAELRTGIEQAIRDTGVAATILQLGSVWSLYFTRREIASCRDISGYSSRLEGMIQTAYRRFLLSRGFYLHQTHGYLLRGYLTAAHTSTDVAGTVAATREFFEIFGDELQE